MLEAGSQQQLLRMHTPAQALSPLRVMQSSWKTRNCTVVQVNVVDRTVNLKRRGSSTCHSTNSSRPSDVPHKLTHNYCTGRNLCGNDQYEEYTAETSSSALQYCGMPCDMCHDTA
jgi:hypothetical protein